jgi:hypothetical protein
VTTVYPNCPCCEHQSGSGSGSSGNSGESGSGSSVILIPTACCPNGIPSILYMTFGGALAFLGTVKLLVLSGVRWQTAFDVPIPASCCSGAGVWNGAMACEDNGRTFQVTGDASDSCFNFTRSLSAVSCNPFFWTETFAQSIGNFSCAPGDISITITETPP